MRYLSFKHLQTAFIAVVHQLGEFGLLGARLLRFLLLELFPPLNFSLLARRSHNHSNWKVVESG